MYRQEVYLHFSELLLLHWLSDSNNRDERGISSCFLSILGWSFLYTVETATASTLIMTVKIMSHCKVEQRIELSLQLPSTLWSFNILIIWEILLAVPWRTYVDSMSKRRQEKAQIGLLLQRYETKYAALFGSIHCLHFWLIELRFWFTLATFILFLLIAAGFS